MLNTKQIIDAAVAAGAKKVENVVLEGVNFINSNKDNVDYWVSLRLGTAVEQMREVDGKFVMQKVNTIMISNIGFMALLRELFMQTPELVQCCTSLKMLNAHFKQCAIDAKAGINTSSGVDDLLMLANLNLLRRDVKKDTKVKSLFSLNEKESVVPNDQSWYDPYGLKLTRINAATYRRETVVGANGIAVKQRVQSTVLFDFLDFVDDLKDAEAAKAVEKHQANSFAARIAAAANAATNAAANLPE